MDGGGIVAAIAQRVLSGDDVAVALGAQEIAEVRLARGGGVGVGRTCGYCIACIRP